MKNRLIAGIVCIFAAIMLLNGCAVTRGPHVDNVYIVPSTEKYAKDVLPASEGEALCAQLAKNESESMQFILRFDADVSNIRVTAAELTDAQGNALSLKAYRQHYIYTQSNSTEYKDKTGWYPDALIPIWYEDLNTVDVKANENQGFWLTVTSGADQPAGVYTGQVTVTFDGGERVIPVSVEVWDFALPKESSFKTLYLSSSYSAWNYVQRVNPEINQTFDEFRAQYDAFFLDYGLSSDLFTPENANYMAPVAWADELAAYFEQNPHATMFYIWLNVDGIIDSGELPPWFVTATDRLREHGLMDKVCTYMFDEPGDDEVVNAKIKAAVEIVRSAVPDMQNLITTAPRESLYGVVNTWCGIWSSKTLMENYVRDRQALGESVWWYGCVAPRAPYPTYHIQDALTSARLMRWMQKDWNIDGDLYWAMLCLDKLDPATSTFTAPRDIWTDPNVLDEAPGDGYLAYAGLENDGVINRNIPVPTIRLETIRDGNEDYEYLTLLQSQIERKLAEWNITSVTADSIMDTYYAALYNTMGDFDRDSSELLKMRKQVAHDIMNPEAVVAVFADVTVSNLNARRVTVYAPCGSEVVIDGQRAEEVNKGAYSQYSAVFDMRDTSLRHIPVSVNGEIYTRALKSIEDYEYIELGESRVMRNVESLNIPEDRVAMREIYDKNMFNPFPDFALGNLQDQLVSSGTGARVPVLISDDAAYTQQAKESIAVDLNNTIPLVIKNTASSVTAQHEILTLYAPSGAQVSVNGTAAELLRTQDGYSVYTFDLDCTGSVKCGYEVTVTYNGRTEAFQKIVKNTVTAIYNLLDFSDQAAMEYLTEFNDGSYGATCTVDPDGINVAFSASEQGILEIESECFVGQIRDFSAYNCIALEITNTGTETAQGVYLNLWGRRDSAYTPKTGALLPGQTKLCYLRIPDMSASDLQAISGLGIASVASGGETYKITKLTLMHNINYEKNSR